MGIPIPDEEPGGCPLCCEGIGNFIGVTITDMWGVFCSGLLSIVWPCIYTGYVETVYHDWLWVWVQFCKNEAGDAEGGWTYEPPDWDPKFFGPGAQCSSFTWSDPVIIWVVDINVP